MNTQQPKLLVAYLGYDWLYGVDEPRHLENWPDPLIITFWATWEGEPTLKADVMTYVRRYFDEGTLAHAEITDLKGNTFMVEWMVNDLWEQELFLDDPEKYLKYAIFEGNLKHTLKQELQAKIFFTWPKERIAYELKSFGEIIWLGQRELPRNHVYFTQPEMGLDPYKTYYDIQLFVRIKDLEGHLHLAVQEFAGILHCNMQEGTLVPCISSEPISNPQGFLKGLGAKLQKKLVAAQKQRDANIAIIDAALS